MTHKELLKLYALKGRIQGNMTVAKAEIRAIHEIEGTFPKVVQVTWMDGRHDAIIASLRVLNDLRRRVCQIIKEAESA